MLLSIKHTSIASKRLYFIEIERRALFTYKPLTSHSVVSDRRLEHYVNPILLFA